MMYSRTALLCLSAFFLVACEPSGEMAASDESATENGSSEAMPDAAESEASMPIAQTTTQASLLSEPEWVVLFAGHDLSSFNAVGDAEWNISAMGGYEANIYDPNENPDNRTGSIVGHQPPGVEVLTEEQWNTYEITAQGNRITVVLNGTRTADLEDDTHASGPIAFQNNGGLIRFRNIRLRPL
ncbi:MAG: DUF1080 domain-containing protein [Proteobacteria bacterium]|nr:DUF1080 domain-containing protein [Pseudomonadota bacterium]